MKSIVNGISCALALLLCLGLPAQAAPSLEQIGEFAVPDANQGIGVDHDHFYAVNNRAIGKYDKRTGARSRNGRDRKRGRSSTSTARW